MLGSLRTPSHEAAALGAEQEKGENGAAGGAEGSAAGATPPRHFLPAPGFLYGCKGQRGQPARPRPLPGLG